MIEAGHPSLSGLLDNSANKRVKRVNILRSRIPYRDLNQSKLHEKHVVTNESCFSLPLITIMPLVTLFHMFGLLST